MDTYSQMLCRFEKPSPTQAPSLGTLTRMSADVWSCVGTCLWTFSWSFACFCAVALATPTAPASVPPPSNVSSPTGVTPLPSAEMTLLQTARDWISHRTGISVDDIQMNTLDVRLKVTLCESPTLFDQPFANRHVIRARCEQPRWQYFLQASWSQSFDNKKTNTLVVGMNANSSITGSPAKAALSNPPTAMTPVSYPNSTSQAPNANVFGEVVRTVLVLNQPLKKGTILNASQFKKIAINVPQSDGQILTQTQEIEILNFCTTWEAIKSSTLLTSNRRSWSKEDKK